MKDKNKKKKLSLSKRTISDLNSLEQIHLNKLHGGKAPPKTKCSGCPYTEDPNEPTCVTSVPYC